MDFSKADKITEKLNLTYEKTLNESYKLTLKNIENELKSYYLKYGEGGILNIEIMSVKDKDRITRLQKLNETVNAELTSLNRGRPQQLSSHLTSVYEENYYYGSNVIKELTDVSFDLINRQAVYQSAISPLGALSVTSNADAVKRNVQRAITKSIVSGDSIQTMAEGVKIALEKNKNDAVRIARTETTRIMGEARNELFKNAEDKGINVEKRWVATLDDKTRDSHLEMDGETVKVNKRFSNGMNNPSDYTSGAPASEIINCRCTMVGVLTDYQDEYDINFEENRKKDITKILNQRKKK